MEDYVIAIPSYKRAKTICEKTLALLHGQKFPSERIYVFVASECEHEQYKREVLNRGLFCHLVIGELGIARQRNFIQRYFPAGQRVVSMDDDIKCVREKVNDKNSREVFVSQVARLGFEYCEKSGAQMWGVYPVLNPLFMQRKITTELKFCIGQLQGMVNTHDEKTFITPDVIDGKEDYERSIKFYLRAGCIVRLNYFACDTNIYNEPGGLQEFRTDKKTQQAGLWLMNKYPMFVEIKRGTKQFEIKLVNKYKKAGKK